MRKKVVLNNGDVAVIDFAKVENAQEIVGYMNLIAGQSDNLSFGENEFGVSIDDEIDILQGMSSTSLMQIFIAVIDGEIVAEAEVHFNGRPRIMHNCALAISVRDDKWGIGLASHMMRYIIKYLKSKHIIRTVLLEVKSDNARAIALYKKYGFVKTGYKKNFLCVDGVKYDIDLMERYL